MYYLASDDEPAVVLRVVLGHLLQRQRLLSRHLPPPLLTRVQNFRWGISPPQIPPRISWWRWWWEAGGYVNLVGIDPGSAPSLFIRTKEGGAWQPRVHQNFLFLFFVVFSVPSPPTHPDYPAGPKTFSSRWMGPTCQPANALIDYFFLIVQFC